MKTCYTFSQLVSEFTRKKNPSPAEKKELTEFLINALKDRQKETNEIVKAIERLNNFN